MCMGEGQWSVTSHIGGGKRKKSEDSRLLDTGSSIEGVHELRECSVELKVSPGWESSV